MDEALREEFRMPGADKRSIPFWAWNARMDEEELRSQVRQMKEAGVGGFFIHSREGLETDYLGEKWMSCVKAVVEEAKIQGIYAWLYDEDRWPSGTAGGRVTSCGDAYRCKGLTMEILPTAAYGGLYEKEIRTREASGDEAVGILAAYRAEISGDNLVSYQRLEMGEEESFAENDVVLAVRLEVSAPSEWFNHEAPPDNLNPDCVRKFIQETHEKYREAVGEEFGKTIRGIFTDEPSLNDRFSYFGEKKSWIPWTYGYGAFFKERMGYDFLDVLPLFYFHGENSAKIRHDYWCSIAQRYGESYFKTLGEWCKENHLLFTGHFLQEDKLGLSTRVNGAVMPHYQYMHVPGIDMLCEQTNEYMTVKQCTSVARQLGKKHVITETYGCTGWDFTFEGQKWMGDWQYVLGVNRRCQHLMHYSLRGCRKRDYPPCFNYNTTWWRENRTVDDYFARLSAVLEQGDAVRDILLLHPVSTAWSRLGVNPYGNPKRREERDVPGINEYGNRFNGLIEYLMRRHLDCDLGDELIIRRYGRAESGKFVIGEAAYRAVALPPMDTMLLSTAEKLLEYMEQGGFIYAMTPCAYLVEADREHRDILEKLAAHRNWHTVDSREELAKSLEPYRRIRVENGNGEECEDVLYQLRKKGEEYYLFLVNNNRNRTADVTVKLEFPAAAMQMDLLSGEVSELPCGSDVGDGVRQQVVGDSAGQLITQGSASQQITKGNAGQQIAGNRANLPPAGDDADIQTAKKGTILQVHLEKTGSALFCLRERKTETLRYEGPFSYRLNHRNVLTLDMCRYRMNGGAWSGEVEVWQAQKEIRETLKMCPIYHNGIEQRYKWIDKPHPGNGALVELAFRFTSELSVNQAAIALERPEEFRISLNGQELPREMDGWLLDKEIRKWKLPEIVQGENELILACAYRNDMELENIYLEGAFGVDVQRRLTALSEKLCPGSWTEQGLRHYCGNVTYLMEYRQEEISGEERVWIKLPPTEGICVKVRVNGNEAILPWNFERMFSIENWLRPGENAIEVEVVGSPRNMMGPFHLKEKPASTSDASFCPPAEDYSEDYLLTAYGIMGAIKIIREQ